MAPNTLGPRYAAGYNAFGHIFNNLPGHNFVKPEPWRTQSYDGYLAFMERDLGVSFAGKHLTLHAVGGPVLAVCSFG
jgi:hypothetical protein